MTFDEILYNDSLLDALDAMNFSKCTPIQEQAIQVAQQGRDLIAIAQTGTGKTAAYLLPVIDRLSDGGYPTDAINCVVMAPTRELVQQIDQQMQGFGYFLPVSSLGIYGGTDGKIFDQQKKGLTMGADIVIATPGRLLAHLSMGYVDLSKVSFFILDEADRMLDMGFFDDIMQIVAHLPKERQTLMFSATMPPKIKQLAQQILNNPAEVKIAVSKPAERIEQSVYICRESQKEGLLCELFAQTPPDRVIVFASSKLKVKQLTRELKRRKLNVAEMHSDLDQAQREQVMLNFKAGRVKVLVATDIVSRGIDIDDISMVVNFDVPHDAEDYVHRVGRTARAAAAGRAVTFVGEKERMSLKHIEKLIEKEVPRAQLPDGFDKPSSSSRHDNDRRHTNRKGKSNNKSKRAKTTINTAPTPTEQQQQPNPKKKRRFNHHRRKPASGHGNNNAATAGEA